jgi:parvulin-like peptidyl-prolyl isomerase
MKKLPFKRRKEAQKAAPARITNETVAEHRERILAGGRRFKYPMQYARHKLVFNMDNAIADAYAAKLAREMNISVSDQDVENTVKQQLNTSSGHISQETYDASTLNILGWAPDEYRQAIKNKLILKAVSYAIDTAAKDRADKALTLVNAKGADFNKIAAALGGDGNAKVTVGVSGMVPLANSDGGLSAAAATLKKGESSSVIKTTTGDGYYVVRLIEKTDTQINYQYIRIPLTAFSEKLAALKKDGKIHEYISIPNVDNQPIKK